MDNFGNQIQFSMYQTMFSPDPNRLPVAYEEWKEQARNILDDGPFYYIAGGAGGGNTMKTNIDAFNKWEIVPKMLQDVKNRDLSVNLFGQTYPFPVLHAPIGVQSIIHKDGDLGSAKACSNLGVPFIASSASTLPLEDIAASMGDTPFWFQLYWSKDHDIAASFIRRAEKSGYSAIVVTLDTPMMAWRENDLKNVYLPFLMGQGLGNYFTDPVFRSRLDETPEDDQLGAIMYWTKIFGNPTLTWDDLSFLRKQTKLPIILKGILHPEDAQQALDHGIDGLIVSNHGGRQVDGAIGALDALPVIRDVVQDKVPILMDSGIRRGSDIIKALALGAKAVLVGRPCMYGLAVAGEQGVKEVLENMIADLDITMALTGKRSIQDLNKTILRENK